MEDYRTLDLTKFCKHHGEYQTSLDYLDIFAEEDLEVPHLIEYEGGEMIHRDSIIAIQSKPKEGKSTAALCFVMALLSGGYAGLKAVESDCVALWIDTEMGERETRRRMRYALEAIGMDSPEKSTRLKALTLKTIPVEQRLDKLIQAVKEVCPDLVVLDGIADLVHDFNDNKECFSVTERLGDLVEEHHCAMINIIHENRQDGGAKGHAGSASNQKATELYGARKDGNNVKLEYLGGRWEGVKDFTFSFGEHGIPTYCGDETASEKADSIRLWAEILNDCTVSDGGYTYTEIVNSYMEHKKCKKRTAKDYISKSVSLGTLQKSGDGKKTRYTPTFYNIDTNDTNDEL